MPHQLRTRIGNSDHLRGIQHLRAGGETRLQNIRYLRGRQIAADDDSLDVMPVDDQIELVQIAEVADLRLILPLGKDISGETIVPPRCKDGALDLRLGVSASPNEKRRRSPPLSWPDLAQEPVGESP